MSSPARGEAVQSARLSGIAGAPRSLRSKAAREKPGRRSGLGEEVKRFLPLFLFFHIFARSVFLERVDAGREGAFWEFGV